MTLVFPDKKTRLSELPDACHYEAEEHYRMISMSALIEEGEGTE